MFVNINQLRYPLFNLEGRFDKFVIGRRPG